MGPAHATTCHLITSGMKMLSIEPEAGMQARVRSGQEVSSVHRTRRIVQTYSFTAFATVHTFLCAWIQPRTSSWTYSARYLTGDFRFCKYLSYLICLFLSFFPYPPINYYLILLLPSFSLCFSQYLPSFLFSFPYIMIWLKETAVVRLRHGKHAITSVNKEPLRKERLWLSVFYAVRPEAT
jgi:hypothetical protein